jgi:hypothetical protein
MMTAPARFADRQQLGYPQRSRKAKSKTLVKHTSLRRTSLVIFG